MRKRGEIDCVTFHSPFGNLIIMKRGLVVETAREKGRALESGYCEMVNHVEVVSNYICVC